ncbi:MAG: PGF-pre-PGF domain-containing protein, partial [Candidatus Aenigmatarchaeota archaeon]
TTTASIMGNTMCYNGNTTYWALNNNPYGGGAGNVMWNIFCVNISRPIKGGCTNADEVRFYVSGNPLSWVSGGETNCTLKIDDVYRNHTQTPGAYHTVNLAFNGTEVGDGPHNLTVHCDPYNNVADDSTDYNRDTQGPGYSSGGSGGPCENVTLAVYWTDGTCNVSYAVLSTNETTAHLNYTNGAYGSPKAIEWNESWSNFSWWNESVKNNYINWLVWANDSAGNWNRTENATFLAQECAVSVVPSGGGGGGAPAPPSDCFSYKGNMTLSPILSKRTVSCSPQTDFTLFNLTFSSTISVGSKLVLEEAAKPSLVPAPAPAVYKYYKLTAFNLTDSYLSRVLVLFTVPNSWINGSKVAASDVGLYRWTGTEWELQPTVPKSSVANASTFQSFLTSIETGTFAIAASKACPDCPPGTGWGACVDGRQERVEWTCSVATDFECQNITRTRNCVCPAFCPDAEETDCIDGKKNVTTYHCSEQTDFECAPKTEEVACAPKLPQLLLLFWEDFESAPPRTQAIVVVGAVIVVGGLAGAGYWWFALRTHPERTERLTRLFRKRPPAAVKSAAPAAEAKPQAAVKQIKPKTAIKRVKPGPAVKGG